MSSLLALLSQHTPNLQTRRGLMITGLQNDFTSAAGKLPVQDTDFIDQLAALVPRFREHGDVIWVQSVYETVRPAEGTETVVSASTAGGSTGFVENPFADTRRDDHVPAKRFKAAPIDDPPDPVEMDEHSASDHSVEGDDEELFSSSAPTVEPCCLRGSPGADYDERAKALQDPRDMYVTKSQYSAFSSSSLLLTLRSKLITELFICGCMTNSSVYSTAVDAARHGIHIILVEDCLGYRRKDRHDVAVRQLQEIVAASSMNSVGVISYLNDPQAESYDFEEDSEDEADGSDHYGNTTSQGSKLPWDHALEVDDDENDDESSLPIEHLSKTLDRRLNLHRSEPPSTPLLPLARATRHVDDEFNHARSTASLPDSRVVSRGFNEQTSATVTSTQGQDIEHKIFTTSHRGARGAGSESIRHLTQHWLDPITRTLSGTDGSKVAPRSSHPGLAALSTVAGLSQSTVEEYEGSMRRMQEKRQMAVEEGSGSMPLLGKDKEAESADSRILYDLMPTDLAETVFDKLSSEIQWQKMHHQTGEVPRLVCCQCTVGDDGSTPVYRHPSDRTLPAERWTSTVERIREAAEGVVGHTLNHALIQLYRTGNDYISEHSDKTLDIVPNSFIVNVSFGAQRTMRLRTKRSASPRDSATLTRTTYRVPLPHNSMISMSLRTNAQYLHGINADKRPTVELRESETAFGGQRISLTFRHIGTFLSRDSTSIWGQGAVGKTRATARPVLHGDLAESSRLLQAFGAENQASSIVWEESYGRGFDVLHLK